MQSSGLGLVWPALGHLVSQPGHPLAVLFGVFSNLSKAPALSFECRPGD